MLIFLSIVAILILATFKKLYIKVESENDRLCITLIIFGKKVNITDAPDSEFSIGKLIKKHLPQKKSDKQESGQPLFDKIQQALDIYAQNRNKLQNIKKYLCKKIIIEDLQFSLEYGFGDAAYTGIFTGFAWAMASNAHAFLTRHFKIKKNSIKIEPDFSNEKFNAYFCSIISFRTAHIIVAAGMAAWAFASMKLKKDKVEQLKEQPAK